MGVGKINPRIIPSSPKIDVEVEAELVDLYHLTPERRPTPMLPLVPIVKMFRGLNIRPYI